MICNDDERQTEESQGFGGLEAKHRFGRHSLSDYQDVSSRRALWSGKPDEKSGSLYTVEHRSPRGIGGHALRIRTKKRKGWEHVRRIHDRLAREAHTSQRRQGEVNTGTKAVQANLLRGLSRPEGCAEEGEVLEDYVREALPEEQAAGVS